MKPRMLDSLRYMWPSGVDNIAQMRDIIRVYCMGWMDAMMRINTAAARLAVEMELDNYKAMTQVEWLPDSSWQWWDGPPLAR